MLRIPPLGSGQPGKVHQVDLAVLCDWVEASVLFDHEELAQAQVVDVLEEEQVCPSQDAGWVVAGDAWIELQRRQAVLGSSSPFRVAGQRLIPVRGWRESPAPGFFLALTCTNWNAARSRSKDTPYSVQGEIFEALAEASVKKLFPLWGVRAVGWSPTNPCTIREVAARVASELGAQLGDVEGYASKTAKDCGLDILMHRTFRDGREKIPVYLMQCASGRNWERKLTEPNLELWSQLVRSPSHFMQAFAFPHVIGDDVFRQRCVCVRGLVLDRYRILSAGVDDPDWVPEDVRRRVVRWAYPRVRGFARYKT
jgi:hypothetical protein